MAKGFDISITLFLAVAILLFTIGVFWLSMVGSGSSGEKEEIDEEGVCKFDIDCAGNLKCIQIYPGNFTSFCGCIVEADCDGGVCGSDNRCA